jgi:hypothetical protein
MRYRINGLLISWAHGPDNENGVSDMFKFEILTVTPCGYQHFEGYMYGDTPAQVEARFEAMFGKSEGYTTLAKYV